MRQRLLDRILVHASVQETESLPPRFRRIRLHGPALVGLDWIPGQQVRVQVDRSPSAVDWLVGTLRTYSVWSYDGEHLDLIVFNHGDGPGARWGREAEPGDELMLMKPHGTFTTADAGYHLFAGEETAQVAFGPMVRALPPDANVFVRLVLDSVDDRLAIHDGDVRRRALDVAWTYRDGRPAAASDSLVEQVRALNLPQEPGIAYLAGEARTIQKIRRHLVVERGWPRRAVLTKPFWTPGRKGLD